MEKDVSYDELQHAYEVLQELNNFRDSKEQCDFIIKVGSKEILVHRNVLCANSDYFKAMLAHDTRENQTGCVELKDMDEECVLKCADFMYGKKISISDDKWQQMVHSADRLQIRRLIEHLVKFFHSHLEVQNVYTLWKLALTYHFSDLEKKCEEFAAKNFNTITQFDDFNELSLKDLEILIESPKNEASETSKLMAFLKWIQHDSSSREEFLPFMFRKLDLSQISVQYKRHLVENQPLIVKSFDTVKLLCISVMDSFDVSSIDPAGYKENKCLVLFDDSSRHLQCFNPKSNTFSQMHALEENMSTKRINFSAVALLDAVYVLVENKSVHRLKLSDESAKWQLVANTIDDHGRLPPAVTFANNIYVVGIRWRKNYGPSSVEMYQSHLDKWTKLTERELNKDFACVHSNRHLYCIGVRKMGDSLNTVDVYNLDSGEWSSSAPPLHARRYAASIHHLDKIYVMSGEDDKALLSSVECYDTKNDIWTSVRSMLIPRNGFAAYVTGGDIFAVGDHGRYPSTMEKYGIANDEWTEVDIPVAMDLKILWSVGFSK